MFDLKTINLVIDQLSEERGIPREKMIDAIEGALATAYKREYGKPTRSSARISIKRPEVPTFTRSRSSSTRQKSAWKATTKIHWMSARTTTRSDSFSWTTLSA